MTKYGKPKILVVGSLMMDLIVSTPRFPERGETVLGMSFTTAPGGKGANQAYQAARLGAEVTMVGCVGKDAFGQEIKDSLERAGVDVSHVREDETVSTAVGNVQIEQKDGGGDNRIIVVSGANMSLNEQDVLFLEDEIENFDILLLQLEVPEKVNLLAARYAFEAGVPVMLNPAPYAPISSELLSYITCLSPNEHEAADLTGIEVVDEESALAACKKLQDMGVGQVIITRGKAGAIYKSKDMVCHSSCVPCEKVADPTAAGDSFIGAYCTACCFGATVQEALRFANYTAHITVSRPGAQPSLPSFEEVIELMHSDGISFLTERVVQ